MEKAINAMASAMASIELKGILHETLQKLIGIVIVSKDSVFAEKNFEGHIKQQKMFIIFVR